MALPATYNISYYSGDTYKFYIIPKDSEGNAIDLAGYSFVFAIAETRGGTVIPASATSDADKILCEITAEVGTTLDPTKTYVYDVELSKDGEVYTYLTGSISITEDVA